MLHQNSYPDMATITKNFHYNAAAGVEALHLNGVTGRGITIAVVDSGLWEHPALTNDTSGKPRLLAKYDAIANVTGKEVFDASGHGTHMTSIIAHNGPVTRRRTDWSFQGVAPDVNPVSVKAFDVAGQGRPAGHRAGYPVGCGQPRDDNIARTQPLFHRHSTLALLAGPIEPGRYASPGQRYHSDCRRRQRRPDPMTIGSPGNLPFVITVGLSRTRGPRLTRMTTTYLISHRGARHPMHT